MGSLMQQQQQQQVRDASRIIDVNVNPSNNLHTTSESDYHGSSNDHEKPGWRKFLPCVGPGFLVSLAYLDPGNIETDLQAGANHGYELLWVILTGMVFVLIIQSLAASLARESDKGCVVSVLKFSK